MISEDRYTVFVIGAGAGKPYGFPLGSELKNEIVSQFSERYFNYVWGGERKSEAANVRMKVLHEFTSSLNRAVGTIDSHILRNPTWEKWGKLAITLSISHAELKFKLNQDADIVRNIPLKPNWIEWLVNFLLSSLGDIKDYNISRHSIAFITFNYDRLLEYLLVNLLWNTFIKTVPTIQSIIDEVKKIPIVHVYGKLDHLQYSKADRGTKFGIPIQRSEYDNLSDNIQVIIHESNHADQETPVEKAATLLHKAKRVFFLGFGYDQLNLKQLKIPHILQPDVNLYGTAINLEQAEIERVKYQIADEWPPYDRDVYIEEINCLKLLRRYLTD